MAEFNHILKHSNWLQPLARSLVQDDHLADDVLQEAWLAAWRNPPREQQATPAWLKQVVYNLVHMQFRGDGRRRKREQLVARPETQNDDLALEAVELRHDLALALTALDEPFRTTLYLRFYEGLSSAEIARRQDVPAATVRVRLKRGLDRLREQLGNKRENYLPALLLIAGPPLGAGGEQKAGSEAAASPGRASHTSGSTAQTRLSSKPRLAATALITALAATALLIPLLTEGTKASSPATARRVDQIAPDPPASLQRNSSTQEATSILDTRWREPDPRSDLLQDDDDHWAHLRVVDPQGRAIGGARVSKGERRLELEGVADGYASTYEYLLSEPSPDLLGHTGQDGTLRIPKAILLDASLAASAAGFMTGRERPVHRQLVDGTYTLPLAPSVETEITIGFGGLLPDCEGIIEVKGRNRTVRYAVSTGSSVTHTSEDDCELVSFHVPGFASVQDLLLSPRHQQSLVPGRSARGYVVDNNLRPVAAATVSMRSSLWRGPPHTVTTDDQGYFETFPLPESGTLDLHIHHPDYPSRTSSHELPCTELGDLALDPGHSLQGRVLRPNGSPCPDALILALPEGRFFSRDVRRTRSERDGSFQLPAMAAGSYVLRAEHDDYAPFEQQATASDHPPATIRLGTGTSVQGRVVDEAGQPVAGVAIRVGTIVGDELRGPVARTSDTGHFRLDHLPETAITHRPRRRVLRWSALDGKSDDALGSPRLLAELFLPYQLLRVNDVEIPQPAHFGSRNTAAVQPGTTLSLVVAHPTPQPSVDIKLSDRDGTPLRAFSNMLIVSPNGWIMKDFAGVDGQPLRLPHSWVLDDAQLTMMSRGYAWKTVRPDFRADAGKVHFALHRLFERPPLLQTDAERPTQLLAAPLIGNASPLAALPIGETNSRGGLVLSVLGPGQYELCVLKDPSSLYSKRGKRRLAVPMEELNVVGEFTLTDAEGQVIPLQLVLNLDPKEGEER